MKNQILLNRILSLSQVWPPSSSSVVTKPLAMVRAIVAQISSALDDSLVSSNKKRIPTEEVSELLLWCIGGLIKLE